MKPIDLIPISPPPEAQRVNRAADFAGAGERRSRYSLPTKLDSASPVGYRTRCSLSQKEASEALGLLSMTRPSRFAPPQPLREQELFEECSLGVLSSRQSTNFRGFRQVTFGADRSAELATWLRSLQGLEALPLDDAAYTHVVLGQKYRNPFTMLLTLVGHKPVISLLSVPLRVLSKRFRRRDDIPTIGYLPHIHIGILADCMERAAVIASAGRRRAQAFLTPFADEHWPDNRRAMDQVETLCGMSAMERLMGWRISLVSQVGSAIPEEEIPIQASTCRKLGANLMAFRSERIQPGVNQEEKAPQAYQQRQDMDVPDQLTDMAGRAAYNAFAYWTGCDREQAKQLLLLDRIDVLTPDGKERLRAIRRSLNQITDWVIRDFPLWADRPLARVFSRNAERGRKAFALAGQRIYVGGLSRPEVEAAGLGWTAAVRAFGAAAARSALVGEIAGVVDIPSGCDMLAGICLMAGPVNQNDIGKSYYGLPDLLAGAFPGREPTSLLVWSLKAKTVADPIGNEEQLLNAARKGALVDLRPGPHEVIQVSCRGKLTPMRQRAGVHNQERAFGDVGNFVSAPDSAEIPGNSGSPWSGREESVW